MQTERRPAEIFGIAEFLYDELVARGWKTADAARLFDNGCSQAFNLLLLNVLMLGHTQTPMPHLLLVGLCNALGWREAFLRALEQPAITNPDRVSHWVCPVEILSGDFTDFVL